MRIEVRGNIPEKQGWGLSSMDSFSLVLEAARLVGLLDNTMASLVLTRSGRDFMGLTRRPEGPKGYKSPCGVRDGLRCVSRMFAGRYGSHSWSHCSTSSHRLRRVWISTQEMPASSSPEGDRWDSLSACLAFKMATLSFMLPV